MQEYRADYRLCYAHRVWSPAYSFNPKCRMIHGHTAEIGINIQYNHTPEIHRKVELAIDGVVKFFDERVFNRFIIDSNDPMFYSLVLSMFTSLADESGLDVKNTQILTPIILSDTGLVVAHEVNLTPFAAYKNSPVYDVLKSYFVVEFCPTSDNLAQWLYRMMACRLSGVAGCEVGSVEWSSVPKRKIIYKP